MDKEKQIEEMAKHCTYHHNGECFAESNNPTDCDLMCEMFGLFANLEMAGYRKASEIFEEIEEEIKNHGICYAQRKIAELKKKYTESSKEITEDGK